MAVPAIDAAIKAMMTQILPLGDEITPGIELPIAMIKPVIKYAIKTRPTPAGRYCAISPVKINAAREIAYAIFKSPKMSPEAKLANKERRREKTENVE